MSDEAFAQVNPGGQDALPPTVTDAAVFPLASAGSPQVPAATSAEPSVVGPGVIESLFWFLGVLVVHGIGAITGVFALIAWNIIQTGQKPVNRVQWDLFFQSTVEKYGFEIVAVEMAIFVTIAVGAALLRLCPRPLKALSIAPIPGRQLLLIVTGALPLAIFCGGLHEWLTELWRALATDYPLLQRFSFGDTNDLVKQLSDSTTLFGMVLVIALAPALSEEIIFRGVIGRGLTKRYGVVFGVIVTSILFGLIHVHPAHALAVIPMGIYIHIAYLSSGSFLAPVLVHLINNSFAAVMLAFSRNLEGPAAEEAMKTSPWVTFVSLGLTLLTVTAMWKNRVQVETPASASTTSSDQEFVLEPAEDAGLTNQSYIAAAGLGFLFSGLLVVEIVQMLNR